MVSVVNQPVSWYNLYSSGYPLKARLLGYGACGCGCHADIDVCSFWGIAYTLICKLLDSIWIFCLTNDKWERLLSDVMVPFSCWPIQNSNVPITDGQNHEASFTFRVSRSSFAEKTMPELMLMQKTRKVMHIFMCLWEGFSHHVQARRKLLWNACGHFLSIVIPHTLTLTLLATWMGTQPYMWLSWWVGWCIYY